jgi:hypothetical protein
MIKTMKLLYLFLILFSTLYAQEVGVPYVKKYFSPLLDATILNDENTFLTAQQNGKIIRWQLNPFKKIDLLDINAKRFLITANETKLLYLDSKNKMYLVNYKNNKEINSVQLHDEILQVLIKNNTIITLTFNRKIQIWDSATLREITHTTIPTILDCGDECVDDLFFLVLSDDGKKIVAITNAQIIFYDSESLKNLTKLRGSQVFYTNLEHTKIYHLYRDSQEKIDCIDINLQSISSYSMPFDQFYKKNQNLIPYDMKYVWPILSAKKSLIMVGNGIKRSIQFYNKESQTKMATFYMDSNEHWLIITPDGYFDGSSEARNYLYMKTPSGGSVPIDDATYQKYHKPICLNDSTKDK